MEQIQAIKELIECYKKLPGIGNKTAERLAYATLELSTEDRDKFLNAFLNVNQNVKRCDDCGIFYEDKCPICKDETRNKKILLIISNSKDIYSIERTKEYNGLYFTINGTLSALHNRTAESIGLNKLKDRILKDNIEEIILALPTDLEGETTSLYITNMLKENPVKVSRLAYGLPVGTNLEYLDDLTISQSLKGRVNLK